MAKTGLKVMLPEREGTVKLIPPTSPNLHKAAARTPKDWPNQFPNGCGLPR